MSDTNGAFFTVPFRVKDLDLFEAAIKEQGMFYTNDGDDDNVVVLFTEDGFAPVLEKEGADEVIVEVDLPEIIRPHLDDNQTVVVMELIVDNNLSGSFNTFSFNANPELTFQITGEDVIEQHKNQLGGDNL